MNFDGVTSEEVCFQVIEVNRPADDLNPRHRKPK